MKSSSYTKLFYLLSGLLMLANVSFAQEESITDEELEKYAVAMDSVEAMKENVKDVIAQMVESNEGMTGARYNELSSAIEDEEKLQELEATEEEIAFIEQVKATRDEMSKDISSTFQVLAKDYLGDGGRVYKKIKTAIKSDSEVKTRYKEISATVQAERKEMRALAAGSNDNSEEGSR